MDIKITAKNIKLTPAIREFINTRVSKVENFFDNIVSAQVLIKIKKKDCGEGSKKKKKNDSSGIFFLAKKHKY